MRAIVGFSLMLCLTASLTAFQTVRVPGVTAEKIRLGKRLSLYVDPDGNAGIHDVLADRDGWSPSRQTTPSFGFTSSVYWAAVRLRRPSGGASGRWLTVLDYPLMDRIDWFLLREGEVVAREQTGYEYPPRARPRPHRFFLFPVQIEAGETVTMVFRFQNADRMEFPLTLWHKEAFRRHDYVKQFALGIFLGVIVIMICYNIFLFLSIRDRGYFYYVLFLLGQLLFQLMQTGLGYQWFWPEGLTGHVIPFTIAFLVIAAIQFGNSFLQLDRLHMKLNIWNHGLQGVTLLAFLVGLFLPYSTAILLMVFLAIAAVFSLITSGIVGLRRGYKPARYFMIAWSVFLVASFVYALKVLSFVPSNFLTNRAMQFGTALEIMLLSLGLGYRINHMRKEKEAVQRRMKEKAELLLEKFLVVLSSAIESKDHGTGNHVERVANFSRDLALKAGIDPHTVRDIYLGAMVHDLGKIGVRDSVINKPGRLSGEEWAEMRRHTVIGKKLLDQIDEIRIAAEIAHCHQERWDGDGYPRGLQEQAIPLPARVVTIADYWDAITSARPYRKAFTLEDAMRIMQEERGRAFDPELYDLFFDSDDRIYLRYLARPEIVADTASAGA